MNGYRIASGNAISCGCYRRKRVVELGWKRRLPPLEAAIRSQFVRYRHRSRDRGIEFSVTEREFKSLVTKPCTYCGKFRPLNLKKHLRDVVGVSGVDRIDSAGGYTAGNVVPSCYVCNIAKSVMTMEEFRVWVSDVDRKSTRLNSSH